MNIVQELAAWAKKLPPWQSDAIRRIFTQVKLTADDEEELYVMLLDAHGLGAPDGSVPIQSPTPFSDVVGVDGIGTRSVVLKELHTLDNVNALVPGQSLRFSVVGLTLIFGENGSGKSGYARVLKQSCHAREKSQPILSDVSKKTESRPSATIELLVDKTEHVAVRWTSGSPANELLAQVAVFDSHCARVFIDDANEVVYLPYGCDVFTRLVSLCTSLKARVTSELRKIRQLFDPIDDYSETTAAGRFVRALGEKSDESELKRLTALDAAECARLIELRLLVASAEADPPKRNAARIRRIKTRFQQLRNSVTTVVIALSPDSIIHLATLQAEAAAAAKAADLASGEAFLSDPLKSTGSDAWRDLFDAARRYSTSDAYPDEAFPVVREGAVCLLCQQPLSESAAERLLRFESFVKQDVARQRDAAERVLAQASKTLADLKLSFLDDDPSLLEELRSYDETLTSAVEAFVARAKTGRDSLVKAIADSTTVGGVEPFASPVALLDAAIIAIEGKAQKYDNADDPQKLSGLVNELAELEDRDRLRSHAEAVRVFIAEKKRESGLKKCEKALDTGTITRRGSEVMERAVTEQLSANLKAELSRFDLRCLPVEVKKLGEKGKTKHQIMVATTAKASVVLSEGEQRIIAISSFLAELKTGNSAAPIVFDDPVSSLDHLFREKVARRLVEEAKARQVVIFTHDVVMLLALEREAGEQQVPLLIQTVRKCQSGPGECLSAEPRPWYACNTKERIAQLKNSNAKFKKLSTEAPEEYQGRVAEFYGKLREAWERAIEEVLLNDVVQRFRPSVETQRLKRVAIEESDFVRIENGMSKCSMWLDGHDAAGAIASPSPSPEMAEKDLKDFEDFVKTLRERGEKMAKTLDKLVNPPSPQVCESRAAKVIDLMSVPAMGG